MFESVRFFYEPGTPPPPLPLLTSECSLALELAEPSSLLADEELLHLGVQTSFKTFHKDVPVSTTYPIIPGESLTTETSRSASLEMPIPKPDGEAGRPGRGGYNVRNVLLQQGWDGKEFIRLRVSIQLETNLNRLRFQTGPNTQPC